MSTVNSSPVQSSPGNTRVKFASIEIREHAIIPGDNPSVTSGPPITIDWVAQDKITLSLDEYEEKKPRSRAFNELSMPREVREQILRESGLPRSSLNEATKQANIIRNQRNRTNEMAHMGKVTELRERVVRGLKNSLWNRSQKKEERIYIKNARKISKQYLMKEKSQGQGSKSRRKIDQDGSSIASTDSATSSEH